MLLLCDFLRLVTENFALAFDLREQSVYILLLVAATRACAVVAAWYVGRERKCAVAVNGFWSFHVPLVSRHHGNAVPDAFDNLIWPRLDTYNWPHLINKDGVRFDKVLPVSARMGCRGRNGV